MSEATRRSRAACGKIGFSPLDNETCCGITEDKQPCDRQVALQCRQVAFYMIGHGSHLFSDSEELHGILSEAATLLCCRQEHRRTEALVGSWLRNWHEQERPDQFIQDQYHLSERTPANQTRQSHFEHSTSQISRNNIASSTKLVGATDATGSDHQRDQVVLHPEATLSGRPLLTTNLAQPVALHLVDSRQNRNGQASIPLSPMQEMFATGDIAPQGGYLGRGATSTVPIPPSSIYPRSGSISALRAPTASVEQTSMPPPTRSNPSPSPSSALAESSTKRRFTFSEMRSTILRSISQQRFPSSTLPTLTAQPLPTARDDVFPEATAQEAQISSSVSAEIMRPAQGFRPRLRIRTAVPVVSPVSASASATPSTTFTPASSNGPHLSAISEAETANSTKLEAQSQSSKIDCDICTLTFNTENKTESWACPECHTPLHVTCFQEWNHQNIRFRRQTTCPYCRFVIRRPANY